MNRRRFVTVGAAATVTAVAGCLEAAPTGSDSTDKPTDTPTDSPTDDPNDTPTDDPTDTPTDEQTDDPTNTPTDDQTDNSSAPQLTDSSFQVNDVSCGSQGTHGEVTIGDNNVSIEGTLDGRNGCYTAELVRGEYVEAEDTLFVEVEAVERDDADMCTQCIVEIDYRATFEFDGGEPGVVDLHQRGAFTESHSETESGSA